MIKEFRSARQRYATHLEDEKEKREKSDNERKSRLILDDIEKLKSRQLSLNKSIALLESESTDCMDKGEEKTTLLCFYRLQGRFEDCKMLWFCFVRISL